MNLIRRYLRREILSTFAAVLIVLISILLVQRLAFYLNQVLDGTLSQSAVFSLLGLQVVRFITELLPLSFLLASILAFGRLYKDSEMTAMYALGVSVSSVYRVLLGMAIPLGILLTVLNFWIVPEIAKQQDEVLRKAREDAQLTIIKPGIFREFARGKHTIYVQGINKKEDELQNIFIKTREKDRTYSITLAEKGYQIISPENVRFILLNDGSRTHVKKNGETDRLFFNEMIIRLDSDDSLTWPKAISYSASEVFPGKTLAQKAEFHRRIASPISVFILVLMIPALSHSKPREGRFNKLILGVIFYVIYFNLIGVGQAWIKKGSVSPEVGLWWIHGLNLIFALIISTRHNKAV